mgnify:CR=1 FL=1
MRACSIDSHARMRPTVEQYAVMSALSSALQASNCDGVNRHSCAVSTSLNRFE